MQELGGSTARQRAKLAHGNIPYHRRHAQVMNEVGQGGGTLSSSMSSNFFRHSMKSAKSASSVIAALAANQSLAVTKNCVVYRLFCTFYYCYFLYCLIKLSLSQPTSFTFFSFSSPSHQGERSERLRGPGCRLPGQTMMSSHRDYIRFGTRVKVETAFSVANR